MNLTAAARASAALSKITLSSSGSVTAQANEV
jgi:hypothetical protein